MTLQEQIARRLVVYTLRAIEMAEKNPTKSHSFIDIAAEVERWMEWARRECAYPTTRSSVDEELTLPPDGWQP